MLRTLLIFCLVAVGASGALNAQEDAEFDLRREFPRQLHPSETDRYAAVGIKEWGLAWNVYYTARSYNITDIRGLDNSLATSWLYSFDFAGLGTRAHIEYKSSPEWRYSILPRVDVAYGTLNSSYHNPHQLEDLPFTRNYRGANDMQKLSVRAEIEFAARWRWLWFVAKFDSWMVFRKRDIRANDSAYRDTQLGTLSPIKDRKRTEWEQAYMFGGATGVGFEFYFMNPDTRFILFTLYRPFNSVTFREGSGITHGFELMMRSADFEISDLVGFFFEASLQFYLPTRDFNDIYYSQFSFGVKFR